MPYKAICAATIAVMVLLPACSRDTTRLGGPAGMVVSSHGRTRVFTEPADFGRVPPPPDLGSPDIIPIEWISTQSHVLSINGTRFATGQEMIFRSDDGRAYQIRSIYLLPGATYHLRLDTGKAVGFAYTQFQTPDHMIIYPNWPYPPEPERADADSGCLPQIEGFAQISKDDRRSPAVGVWRSASSDVWRVIIYAHDYRCPDSAGPDRRFSTLLSGSTPWRIGRILQGYAPPVHLILWSDAQVGQPIHRAIYELSGADWRGE
jgi:hypothetical protein